MNERVDMIKRRYPGKIDYSTKHGIMVGYINNRQEVQAVESGWKITPEEMAKFLTEKFSSKEKAVEVVDSPILVPTFKKDDYWYVDGFGDVIESNLSWNKDEMRKHIGHLFLFMKGEWQYSDNGIDWEPAVEALPMPREIA